MSLKSKIVSGEGNASAAGVTADHALKVAVQPSRLGDISSRLLTAQKVYREFFTNPTYGRDMRAFGSAANPVIYTITSKTDRTISINEIRIFINSALMTLNSTEIRRFGPAASSPGLASGLTLNIIQGGVSTPIFLDPVQNIGDFLYWTEDYTNFVDAVEAGIDLLTFRMRLEIPVILPAGSFDRVEFSVRDNLTLLTLFNAVVHGSQELVSA